VRAAGIWVQRGERHSRLDPTLGLVTGPGDDEYGDGPETNGAPAADKPLTKYAVGEPYPGRVQWIDGTCEIRVLRQGVDFVLAVSNPAGHEVRAFRQGNAEFALAPGDHHLVWAYKFTDPSSSNPRNGIAWSDQPWEYHRQAAAGPSRCRVRGVHRSRCSWSWWTRRRASSRPCA